MGADWPVRGVRPPCSIDGSLGIVDIGKGGVLFGIGWSDVAVAVGKTECGEGSDGLEEVISGIERSWPSSNWFWEGVKVLVGSYVEVTGPEDTASTVEAEGFFDRRVRAAASRGSSRVLKAGQIIPMKIRNC